MAGIVGSSVSRQAGDKGVVLDIPMLEKRFKTVCRNEATAARQKNFHLGRFIGGFFGIGAILFLILLFL